MSKNGNEQPAARIDDAHVCKHGGGPVLTASANVFVNSKPFSRATEKARCAHGPDYIVTGAKLVTVNGQPAARVGSKTMHGGKVTAGSPNVRVGGPDAGSTLGNPKKGKEACEDLSKSRLKGNASQSYQNCGVESSRLLVHQATGANPSEQGFLDNAIAAGQAQPGPDPNQMGLTSVESQNDILNGNGVPSTIVPQNVDTVTQGVADGRGLITEHMAGQLWGTKHVGGHAISPTGLDYDANGNLSGVHTVDSGIGSCDRVVPPKNYFKSMAPFPSSPQTNGKIW